MTSTKAATNAANRSSLSWSPHLGIAAPPRELCPTPYRFGPTLIARPCDAVVLGVWPWDEVVRVDREGGRVLGPGLADGLKWGSPSELLEVLGKVVGRDEGQDVGLRALQVGVVEQTGRVHEG